MATNFPDTSINNPNTGVGWANGDAFDDTAESGLIYYWNDPVWKTDFTPFAASDARYVEVDGDNMTGDLTLGTDNKITLDATDGSAEFADTVKAKNYEAYRGTTNTGDPLFIGYSDVGSVKNVQAQIFADGAATFVNKVTAKGFTANNFPYDSSIIPLQVSADTTTKAMLAVFSSGFGGGGTISAAVIHTDGSAEFAGKITSSNVTFNLEPDNDANYVTTTDVDAEGNPVETRVYNGPTLDVKAVIQELQQRVNDRDAVIADLTTRIQTLEGGNN